MCGVKRGRFIIVLVLHPFNGLFSRRSWVSQYQKVKTSLDLNEAKDDGVLGCSGISWTICKQSAPRSRQITTPAPHRSIFIGWMLFLMPKGFYLEPGRWIWNEVTLLSFNCVNQYFDITGWVSGDVYGMWPVKTCTIYPNGCSLNNWRKKIEKQLAIQTHLQTSPKVDGYFLSVNSNAG